MSGTTVYVILDPAFGDRLHVLPIGDPVWIVTGPGNDGAIAVASDARPATSHLDGITTMPCYGEMDRESQFLAYLEAIDLHHGALSTTTPYTRLSIVGIDLRADVRAAMMELGFSSFETSENGFSATRSPAEAARLRV